MNKTFALLPVLIFLTALCLIGVEPVSAFIYLNSWETKAPDARGKKRFRCGHFLIINKKEVSYGITHLCILLGS